MYGFESDFDTHVLFICRKRLAISCLVASSQLYAKWTMCMMAMLAPTSLSTGEKVRMEQDERSPIKSPSAVSGSSGRCVRPTQITQDNGQNVK